MTSHAAAGQLQQRPTAREGGIVKREWFSNPVKFAPEGLQLVRSWDLASGSDTNADPDFSVGLLRVFICRRTYFTSSTSSVAAGVPPFFKKEIKATARWDGEETRTGSRRTPDRPGNSRLLISRVNCGATLLAPSAKRGIRNGALILLPRNASMASSSWSQVIGTKPSSMNYAPSLTARHDDQVDAASAAFRSLLRRVTWKFWLIRR